MNFRTAVKDAQGLGSAKDGVHHWWMQRVTAVALVVLVIWFAFSMAAHAGSGYEAMRAWIGSPFTAGVAILLLATGFYHAQLGLQVVLEDYVGSKAVEVASIIAVKFLAAILALTGILAVLSIAFGG